MKPKHKAPQFDLPVIGQVFNLILEPTGDGEQIQQEMEAAAQNHREAKELEEQEQKNLL